MDESKRWPQLLREVWRDVTGQIRQAFVEGKPMPIGREEPTGEGTDDGDGDGPDARPKPRERVLHQAVISETAPLYAGIAASIAPALVGVVCLLTIVLIPVTLLCAGGIAIIFWYYRRYYASLRVTLTSRDLKVRRGILNREEKSIPLEKITDLAVFQGPIMRHFNLEGIRVETAGQTGAGALVSVIGIKNTYSFRDMVLAQRDRIADSDDIPALPRRDSPAATPTNDPLLHTLTAIHETLQRIEDRLPPRD